MKRVYVAGASRELSRAENIIGQIAVSSQLTITQDWTLDIDAYERIPEHEIDPRTRRLVMERDAHAIAVSDFILFLAPNEATQGAWWELGFAYAQYCKDHRPLILVSGEQRYCSVFTECAHGFFEHDIDAVRWMEDR